MISAQPLTPVKKQPTQSKMTAKQMLGEFYSDKKYLENVVKSEGTMLYNTAKCLLVCYLTCIFHQNRSFSLDCSLSICFLLFYLLF